MRNFSGIRWRDGARQGVCQRGDRFDEAGPAGHQNFMPPPTSLKATPLIFCYTGVVNISLGATLSCLIQNRNVFR